MIGSVVFLLPTKASFRAGIGHMDSTWVIVPAAGIGGVAVATRLGHIVDIIASVALVALGSGIAVSALPEMRCAGYEDFSRSSKASMPSTESGCHEVGQLLDPESEPF
jgi:hypothetical protein